MSKKDFKLENSVAEGTDSIPLIFNEAVLPGYNSHNDGERTFGRCGCNTQECTCDPQESKERCDKCFLYCPCVGDRPQSYGDCHIGKDDD